MSIRQSLHSIKKLRNGVQYIMPMLKLENHSVTQEPIMLLGMTEAIVTDNQYCVFATRAYIVYITLFEYFNNYCDNNVLWFNMLATYMVRVEDIAQERGLNLFFMKGVRTNRISRLYVNQYG